MAEALETADRLKLFISYSRRDLRAADALVSMLEAESFEVKIDRRDLPYGEEWQGELGDFIRGCDTVIWLVSPHSVGSKWCNWELGEVSRLNKRLLPVMVEKVAPEDLPEALGRIHVLPVDGVYDAASHASLLVSALRRNSSWLKESTRLADRAREWIARDRNGNLLLRGPALRNAEAWSTRQPEAAPPPPSEVLELILASRRGAVKRQRWAIGAALSVALMASGLAAVAWWQRGVAQTNEQEAKKQEEKAKEQEREANRQAALAQEQETIAKVNAEEARTQAEIARRNEEEAKRQLQIAVSRQLAAESTLQFEQRLDYALALSAAAAHAHPTYEAVDRLLRANQSVSETAVRFLHGHTDDIRDVAFSPNGQLLATLSADNGRLLVFDVASGKPWRSQATDRGYAMAFSPDGTKLAVGGWGKIHLIDARTGAPVAESPAVVGATALFRLAWSPDSRKIATTSFVWDLDSPKSTETFYHERFRSVATVGFDRSSRLLAAAVDYEHGVAIWDVRTREVVAAEPKLRFHGVFGAFFSPGADYLVARNRELTTVFGGATAKPIHRSSDSRECLTLSADGTRILHMIKEGSLNTLTSDGRLVASQTLRGVTQTLFCAMAESPDRKLIAIGGRNGALALWLIEPRQAAPGCLGRAVTRDGRLAVGIDGKRLVFCDMRSAKTLGATAEHTSVFRKAAVHPGGSHIAAVDYYGTLRAWSYDRRSGAGVALTEQAAPRVTTISFADDRPLLAFGDADGTVAAWDLRAMRHKQTWRDHQKKPVRAVAFNPAGDLLAVVRGTPAEFSLVHLERGTTVRIAQNTKDIELSDQGSSPNEMSPRIVFSPDGKRFGIAGDFGAALWQTDGSGPANPLLRVNERVRDLAFSPDGLYLALAHPHGIVSVRPLTHTGAKTTSIAAHGTHVNVVKYVNGGSMLVTADDYGDVALWDASSLRRIGEPEKTHRRYIAPEELVEFDRQLVALGEFSSRLWSLELEPWIARACRLTRPALDRRQWENVFGRDQSYPPECKWKASSR